MSSWLLLLDILVLLHQANAFIPEGNSSGLLYYRKKFLSSKTTFKVGTTALAPILQVDQGRVHDLDQILKAGVVQKAEAVKWESDYEEDIDGNIYLKDGTSKTIWNYIGQHSGIKFDITKVADDWGPGQGKNSNLVHFLETGIIDVTFTSMSPCCDRYLVHDFTPVLLERDFVVAFYPVELENDIYFRIFSPNLWMALMLILGLLLLVMYLFTWVEIGPEDRQSRFEFVDALSWLFCVISQQGYSKTPSSLSGKFLFLFGFVTGTLVFHGFSANVITILSRSETIDSLEDLIQVKTMNIFESYFPPFRKELRDSNKPIVQDLVRKIESNPGANKCENMDSSIMNDMVSQRDPNTAFVGLELYLRDKTFFSFNAFQNFPCRLKWFKVPMGRQKTMYGVRKHLPQKRNIDVSFLRFRETGLLKKTTQMYMPKSPHCASLNEFQSKIVSFQHVQAAYFLLALGYVSATILLLAEKANFKSKANVESETFELKK